MLVRKAVLFESCKKPTDLIRAGWADKIEGQTFPEEGGAFRMTQYEPFGVCAGIGPWNVTLM